MTGEREVLDALFAELGMLEASAHEDGQFLGDVPQTLAEFYAMAPIRRTASRAAIKGFEQMEDMLARICRTILKMLGYRLKGMTPVDIANKAEELGLVESGARWNALIKLRNELAHEYPADATLRFDRFVQVMAGLPFLFDMANRARTLAADRLTGGDA